jgi:hypothetical protein
MPAQTAPTQTALTADFCILRPKKNMIAAPSRVIAVSARSCLERTLFGRQSLLVIPQQLEPLLKVRSNLLPCHSEPFEVALRQERSEDFPFAPAPKFASNCSLPLQ